MNIPKDLQYTKSHEWVQNVGDGVRIGLTDYAQEQLGDLVFVNLPEIGDTLAVGDSIGDVESVKAVSDVYAPVAGEVVEINEDLLDEPEKINADPYGAWMVQLGSIGETEALLSAEEYEAACKGEG